MIVDRWAEAISKTFQASFDVASQLTSDPNILGDSRETFVRDVLSRFLPKTVVVGTGKVQSADGNQSSQLDVILYRSDFPVLTTFGGSSIFLLEGVIASLEVKSRLNPTKLEEALDNCRSVKELDISQNRSKLDEFCWRMLGKPYGKLDPGEQALIRRRFLPPTYIFGYRGYSNRFADFLNVLESKTPELGEGSLFDDVFHLLPDIVCAEGCVATVADGSFFSYQDSCAFLARKEENPLRLLLAHLVRTVIASLGEPTHQKSGLTYDLTPYLSPAELDDSWQAMRSSKGKPLEQRWISRSIVKSLQDIAESSSGLSFVMNSYSLGGGHLYVPDGGYVTFHFDYLLSGQYILHLCVPKSLGLREMLIQLDGEEISRISLTAGGSLFNQYVQTDAFPIAISGHHRLTLVSLGGMSFQFLRLENQPP